MRIALLAASLFLALPAVAQETAKDDGESPSDIIVIGKETRETARDFVKALPPRRVADDPLARFSYAPVCPAAAGLGARLDAEITARMRRVAAAAKMPLAPEGCGTNALVLFADDKAEMIGALRREHPAYFMGADGMSVDVPKGKGPATAWYVSNYVDRDGRPVAYDADAGYHVVNSTLGPSRIHSTVRPVFIASVVVIERGALEGLSATQVADYAAMRAFTGADPARMKGTDAPTILTLLDSTMDTEIPITLTEWDMSFLRAFYAAPENQFGTRQRLAIGSHMAKEIEAGKKEDE